MSLESVYAKSKCVFPHKTFGKVGKPLLIMLAGYPDNCTSGWGQDAIDNLAKDHRVICLCFPGYDRPQKNIPRWGWTLQQLLEGLHVTIEGLLESEEVKEFNFIIHDWGSFLGLCYENAYPERILKVVCFDVGILKRPPILSVLRILFYQLYFALGFMISMLVSKILGNLALLFFGKFISWTPLGPCPHDTVNRGVLEVDMQMCYPYYHFWLGPNGVFRNRGLTLLRPRFPSKPLLFMYGLNKNVMFHGPEFLQKIDATEGCKWKEYNTGHWILNKDEHMRKDVLREMRHFMHHM